MYFTKQGKQSGISHLQTHLRSGFAFGDAADIKFYKLVQSTKQFGQ